MDVKLPQGIVLMYLLQNVLVLGRKISRFYLIMTKVFTQLLKTEFDQEHLKELKKPLKNTKQNLQVFQEKRESDSIQK
jgi:hypothetical protein